MLHLRHCLQLFSDTLSVVLQLWYMLPSGQIRHLATLDIMKCFMLWSSWQVCSTSQLLLGLCLGTPGNGNLASESPSCQALASALRFATHSAQARMETALTNWRLVPI